MFIFRLPEVMPVVDQNMFNICTYKVLFFNYEISLTHLFGLGTFKNRQTELLNENKSLYIYLM